DLAVELLQLLAKVSQYPAHDTIHATQQVARRNARFEVKQIEQLALIGLLSPHHDPPPSPKTSSRRNHDSPIRPRDFFNSIDPEQTSTASRCAELGSSASLHFDMRRPDHLAPLFRFIDHELPELGRRPGKRNCAQFSKPGGHPWIGEARIDRPIEIIDD